MRVAVGLLGVFCDRDQGEMKAKNSQAWVLRLEVSLLEWEGMMMQSLIDYVRQHSERGACKCGKCIDAPKNPETEQPSGHTANMIFFEVAAKDADAEALRTLVSGNVRGSFCNVDMLDGKEHNYLEVGGWIGDQGLALTLMGLGTVLGLWKLLTPLTMLGDLCPPDLVQQMAGAGMVAIQA